jgi:tripartite-type tricarboxylate transporter receptor subunit TctC
MRTIRKLRIILISAALLVHLPLLATAQTAFPTKPIRILVGFGPGGFTDTSARIVGQKLAEGLGQPVIVENRPGANGLVAGDLTSKSPPDGYTIFMTSPGLATNPSLYDKMKRDPVNDFTAISFVAGIPNLLVVHPSLPAKTLNELFALARARPATLTQASAGTGSPGHLSGELLQIMTKVKFIHVPYKGAQAVIDLVGGHVDLSFPTISSAITFVKDGKLRALGVTSVTRSPLLPNVPAIGEKAVPGYSSTGWYGLVGPPALSKSIVTTLNTEIVRVLHSPDVRERMLREGAQPIINTPEAFGTFLAEEQRKWAKVIKSANIRPAE